MASYRQLVGSSRRLGRTGSTIKCCRHLPIRLINDHWNPVSSDMRTLEAERKRPRFDLCSWPRVVLHGPALGPRRPRSGTKANRSQTLTAAATVRSYE